MLLGEYKFSLEQSVTTPNFTCTPKTEEHQISKSD